MPDQSAARSNERFQVKATADSHMAWLRTRLALERTIDAWIRTSVALIGFGFTIVQFFEKLSGMQGVDPAERPLTARYIGLMLIGCGVLALAVSGWQYRRMVRYLWKNFEPIAGVEERPHGSFSFSIVLVIIFVGVFAFVAVLIRAL